MKHSLVFYNANVLTLAPGVEADSMAVHRSRIAAVGRNLNHDDLFRSYRHIDLGGLTVVPGLVDAHTHFYYFALSFGRVSLEGAQSLQECLTKLGTFVSDLSPNEWLIGEGYAPDRFKTKEEGNRYLLDNISGGRPAFVFSKDQHSAWVNSRALEIAGIDKTTEDPPGGKIERDADGQPTGILRETAYDAVFGKIPRPSRKRARQWYHRALDYAYRRGVTGVHSFDNTPGAFDDLLDLANDGALGVRINYYAPAARLDDLERRAIRYDFGDEFFRVSGIKIFADGSLGSQTALCFNKYKGSKDNYGIEVTSVRDMKKSVKRAAKLGFPCAIHAIGDRAVANVLEALESAPTLKSEARHRIEHLQLVRRKDIARVKKLGVIASVQPSHCPSDIALVNRYWGRRGRNAYIFRTLLQNGVDLALGSDAPIEPLDPLGGMEAAVRRARPGSRNVFYPEERISAAQALHGFTVGAATEVASQRYRGYLLPGYDADFVVLSRDPTRVRPAEIHGVEVLATIVDGKVRYQDPRLSLE